MVKADIIQRVSEKTGIQKSIVSKIFEASIHEIIGALLSNDNVIIRGFGTFKPRKAKARKGRDFSGNPVPIPERVVPVFTPSGSFRQLLEEDSNV